MRAQISTSVSAETRRKADALVNDGGYTYRELVSIGIDRLYAEWQGGTMNSLETAVVNAAWVIHRGSFNGTYDVIVRLDGLHRVLAYGLDSLDDAKALADQSIGQTMNHVDMLEGGIQFYGDNTAYEVHRPRVLAAQLIGGYVGPEWLIEPVGEPSDADDLDTINASEILIMDRNIMGWGEYNAVIRIPGDPIPALGNYYLARLS